ncbi:MAG: biopolymer transporter ExbD [Puniceicoccales bacterium]|jgi:biopolymer transport protein ExbD|nr:biopolymer transporter ExbD [Puniceicoccales bacterium]
MTEILTKRFRFIGASQLQPLDTSMGLFNILNILTLFGMLFLLNSRFILSPGVTIELPQSNAPEARKTMGVVTVQSEKFIMFNGDIFTMDSLKYGMKKYLDAKCPVKEDEDLVLLLRPDRSLPAGILLKICEIARDAGYVNIQIATTPIAGK